MVINKLFDYDDFNNAEFSKVQEEFMEAGNYRRKSWEFTIMSYGLDKLGCFSGTKVALGLGCLRESLIYLYTNRFKHTYATDVAYYPEGGTCPKRWGSEGYTVDEVYESTIPYDKSKLTVLYMDMRNLDFEDETFDVIWCSSSVEHVGDLSEVLTCFKEVERTLKPNGIFSITTEWNLTGGNAVKFSNVQSFDYYVIDKIKKAVPRLELVEPITLERSGHIKNNEMEYMLGKTNNFHGNVIDYTSMSLFWIKK